MKKTVWIYGFALALLLFLLEFIEYRYLIRDLSIEFYAAILAIIFTGLGIWLGNALTSNKTVTSEFEKNVKAIQHLGISDRELEVLILVAEGYSNKQIAKKLFVSINTVKTHLSNLYQKLNVGRRTQAVEKAKKLKLIP